MTTSLIRDRFAAMAVAIESTPGTDVIAGTPASGDWLPGSIEITNNPIIVPDGSFNGTMDGNASSVAGFQPQVRITVPFRGSGTAATAPVVGRLLQCCMMSVTATGSAVGAPTAAASGTTTSVTAASPFGTTADAYNGMPLLVTGDQTFTTLIMDYTTGRVITLGETRTALTTSSLLQIPINNLYAPTSDETVFKTATIYAFKDGLRKKLTGFQGNVSVTLTAGGSGVFTFQGTAQLAADWEAVALPSGAATALTGLQSAPQWISGKSQINKAIMRPQTLTIDWGINSVAPTNPEATYGFDPSVPIMRMITATLDPYQDTATIAALNAAHAANTSVSMMAVLGSTAGNRMGLCMPVARVVGKEDGDRGGLGIHQFTLHANQPDQGAYITFF